MLPKLPRLRTRVSRRDGSVSYFYDHGGTPRRWEPLGKVEAAVRRRYDELEATAQAPAGSVTQMLADCLDALRGKVSDGTLANYRGYKKHLEAVFRDEPRTITQADVLRYLRLCPRMSFRNEIGFLSLAFAHWMDEGRLDFNPCFGVRIKRKGSRRTRLLTNTEIDRIVAAADPQLAVAVELACATGLRIGDLCALRWADFADHTDTRKTGARLRYEASEWLDALLARAKALQPRVASLYVLCDRRGRPMRDATLRDHWDAACERAGVEDAHFHDLRAAGATEIARRGGDAQTYLGHKDARTTAIYLRDRAPVVVTPHRRKA